MEITLRHWRESDAPRVQALADDPTIERNLRDGFPIPYTMRDANEFIATCLAATPGEIWHRAVCVDGAVAGSAGVFRLPNVYRCGAEIGYWLGTPYHGKGVMTEAVRQLCALVFAQSDILRIEAGVYGWNAASARVLEKAGFTLEAVQRNKVIKHGAVGDVTLYALIRE